MIVVVDYGMGNLGSILNMLKKIGAEASVSRGREDVLRAKKLILPGVGAFDTAIHNLLDRGLKDALDEQVLENRVPTIGLCLGMQLLTEGSEEGSLPGLGWIAGTTKRFHFDEGHDSSLKVPHMGWNSIRAASLDGAGSPLVRGLADPSEPARFYFVHSYHVTVRDQGDAAAWTHHGYEFVSMIQRNHIMGTQFHPEKSHRFGMKLLRNFAEMP